MDSAQIIDKIIKNDFHSFLIESKQGGSEIIDKIKLETKLAIGDCFEVIDRNITIKDIRNLEKWAQIYPSGVGKLAILDYEKLSLTASHAFLKLLEEPPEYLKIILICSDRKQVLATIQSRCQLYSIDNFNQINLINFGEFGDWEKTINLSLKEQFDLTLKLSKRDDLVSIVDNWIISANNKVGEEKYIWLAKLLEVKKRLVSANINKRILLDNLFLSLN
ncbi:MAG: polymerase III delta subunit protein [Berkelbacteria bacterium GW2011_GWA2_35_9]|uniref:Polymerase III delta subunit protein n=1 Tax=Berkelbacteria bacterium GW2011_GWA2_35_9 TaxID=1618333 RepID=A0A0G0DJB7_9BACT|nr:MAG: polymerase III delta subunit protein [Berkelbacteria bacterium GW2011_GWA2_35_9]